MNILKTIGNTPLVKIEKLNPKHGVHPVKSAEGGAEQFNGVNPVKSDEVGISPKAKLFNRVNIFAKLEGFNPSGSVKDRVALAMIEQAEKAGILTKDKTIIEPTSGNTGISLAMIGAVKEYKVKIVMPESMSVERRKMLKVFGVEFTLVKEEEWRDGAIKFVKSLAEKDKNLVLLNQYENGMNSEIHYKTTGQEIIEQIDEYFGGQGKIDFFVAGIGTGGTITGIGKKLKEKYPAIKIIGVEPHPKTKIQGLKSLEEGYVPPILDLSVIDEKIIVEDEPAFEMTRKLAQKEGIFAGISSGAVMSVAQEIAKKIPQGNIVTIFPDRGEKYLSAKVFE